MNIQKQNGIGWCTHTWNPVKGLCPVGCSYCYARRIYERFRYDPTIRLDKKELYAPLKLKKPAKIFVGSTIELFGEWIPDDWMLDIFGVISDAQQHTFQFLTKNPQEMERFVFSENCWCGTTIPNDVAITRTHALRWLSEVIVPIKFASFEPLHGQIYNYTNFEKLDWIIIGAETGNRRGKITPKEEWIQGIVDQADIWNVSVFMKDNLKPYWPDKLRQEFPHK